MKTETTYEAVVELIIPGRTVEVTIEIDDLSIRDIKLVQKILRLKALKRFGKINKVPAGDQERVREICEGLKEIAKWRSGIPDIDDLPLYWTVTSLK